MKQMKKSSYARLAMGLLMACPMPASAQTGAQQSLRLYTTDAAPRSYPLQQLDKLTFSSSVMSVWLTDGTTVSQSLDAISKITFGDAVDSPSGIETAAADSRLRISYLPQAECVQVEFAAAPRSITVYNPQGATLRRVTPADSPAIVSLSGLPSGTYIVAVHTDGGIQTAKIAKR